MGAVRLILALSVAIWHLPDAPIRLLGGEAAVSCFFAISGFYMAMVINEKYATSGRGWAGRFYLSRFLRLYPAYLAVCVLTVVSFAIKSDPTVFTARLPVSPFTQLGLAVENIVVIGQDVYELLCRVTNGSDVFNGSYMLVGQAWTLSVEAFFYLLAPFAVRSLRWTAILLLASLALRLVMVTGFGFTPWIWGMRFFPNTLCVFLAGAMAYRLHRRWRHAVPSAAIGKWLLIAGGGCFAISAVLRHGEGLLPADNDLLMLGFYAVFACAIPFVFQATRYSGVDRSIGELSYPLYLVHGRGQGILFSIVGWPHGRTFYMVTTLSLSILAAAGLWLAVERPCEILRQRIAGSSRKSAATKPAAAKAAATYS